MIVIASIAAMAAIAAVVRGAWQLHRLWRAVPRRNADFALL